MDAPTPHLAEAALLLAAGKLRLSGPNQAGNGAVARRAFAKLPVVLPWAALALCLVVLWGPTIADLHRHVWRVDPSSQGPIALGLALWLFWHKSRQPQALAALARGAPQPLLGLAWLLPGLVLQIIGRSQGLIALEIIALVICAFGLTVLLYGAPLARVLWFCFVFVLFSLPLPTNLIDGLTQPLKIGVSWAAEWLLQWTAMPVAREGVVLHVGPYRLLVADACAGLQSLFTLEAMGLLYLNAIHHPSPLRNGLMALMIVPVSFVANTIRVIVLALVTMHYGDAAGRGMAHDFSGLLLFGLAFLLIIGADVLSRKVAAWTSV